MIWKYNIVTIDRLVLCLALRTQEGSEAQVCFFIIQLLLLKAAEFRNRVQEFVKENSPEHWKQSNCKIAMSGKPHFPTTDWRFNEFPNPAAHVLYVTCVELMALPILPATVGSSLLDVIARGNTEFFQCVSCFYFQVFDIVIHRYLELPPVTKSLETLLEHLGCLYKFHDRPVTYLYNTLHYYERKLRDRPALKRRLVSAVLGSLREIRPHGWSLSEAYQGYMQRQPDDISWLPDLDYYVRLVRRIVETMSGKPHFPTTDWRFNEFPNPAAHVLYVTCVELMALPILPATVGSSLLDVIARGLNLTCNSLFFDDTMPESYWSVLHDRLTEVMGCPQLACWTYQNTPFQLFNFATTNESLLENKFSYTLALAHSMWHHAGVGQLSTVPQFVKECLRPLVRTEEQLLFLCHLVGPFLQRFNTDHPRCVMDLTLQLYESLEQVDKSVPVLRYMDPICDLLYPFELAETFRVSK
ncbi:hypothetical protein J437_LFUL004729 [Ladona fulva]|uniref:Mediator of RNA polymerase II transcription subunit 23 n=1 Tax=Ladona fulva TaxID=123851 RepID=A0A8K0NW31_LADFU|nr:hypothetical protein J437_LFUL004729 [Ladona fulva]